MKSYFFTGTMNLKGLSLLFCLLLALPVRMMAQEVDELQRLLDEYAARDAGKKKANGMRKVDASTVPTDLQEIDLSRLTTYTKSTRTVTVRSDVKFVNGTIGAAGNFSGTYLLSIQEGATVVLGETATIDAAILSCGSCLSAVNISGGSTFYQCGDVTSADNGNCVAIRLEARADTYVYVSGNRKGTVQNNGGTVLDNVQLGDVNNDGTVNIADAMGIFSWLLENQPTVFVQSAADFNQDGIVTVSDGVAIIASLQQPQAYLSCPDDHHPHMIDLGLPSGTKWQCCNEGASKPEDFGGYYKFGEVSSAPSLDQIKELLNNCRYSWTTLNGVNGGRFTGKNGGTIFLPAAGIVMFGELYNVGSDGHYWSSTPNGEDYACYLYFGSGGARWDDCRDNGWGSSRGYGLSVRPVR